MTDKHPITLPRELVQQWIREADGGHDPRWQEYEQDIANRAAQWGADQELEACCSFLEKEYPFQFEYKWECTRASNDLRAARRPKPPSLKEQALEAAQRFYANGHDGCNEDEVKDDFDIICRALESLPS